MYSTAVIAAVSYIAGVLTNAFNEGFILIFILTSVISVSIISIFSRSFNLKLLICILLFCTGNIRCNSFINKDSILNDYAYEYVYITATVCDIPEFDNNLYGYTVQTESFLFETSEINHICIMNITSEKEYKFGDKIRFYGILKPYSENTNSAAFNAKQYYNTKSIFFKMHSPHSEYIETVSGKDLRFFAAKQRNTLHNIIAKDENPLFKGMSSRIFLNFSADFDEDLKSDFLKAGTWRYLYSSRIHFLIIIGIFALLNKLLSKKIRDFIMFFVLILYAFMNRDSGTGLRIVIFTLITFIYVYKNGTHNFIDSFFAMVFTVGIINPMMFYNSGFIISALSCAAIHIFYKPMKNNIKKLIKNDRLSKIITIYILFTIIMAPVSLLMGFDLSLYSLSLTPVFMLLIVICYITAPFYFIFSDIAIFEKILHFIYQLMLYITQFMKKAPGVSFYFACPTLLFMITWYTGMLSLRYKHFRKHLSAAFCTFLVLLVTTEAMRLDDIEVHFVSVGQGDGAVVSLPYKTNIIIDAGGTETFSQYDHGEAEFVPYLKLNGLSVVDAALVSHYHSDHAVGMISVMENFKVNTLYLPYYAPDDDICGKLISAAEASGTNVVYVSDNQILDFKDGLKAIVKLTYDGNAAEENLNEQCAVYKFEYGDFSSLFTGDIGAQTEKDIIESGYDLKCDVLKVPHHGSKYSSSDELLSAASPKYAFAGIGFDNVHNFPTAEALERYKNHKIPFYSTASSGNIVVKSDKKENIKIYRN